MPLNIDWQVVQGHLDEAESELDSAKANLQAALKRVRANNSGADGPGPNDTWLDVLGDLSSAEANLIEVDTQFDNARDEGEED